MRKAVLFGFALLAVAAATPAHAQDKATATEAKKVWEVDKSKAKQGAAVFGAKMCMGCHTVGKGRLAGPDLAGLLERRETDWVLRWLKDPTPMFETDSTAKALLKEYNNVKMPNMKLTDAQIDQVIHYIVEQGQKSKKK